MSSAARPRVDAERFDALYRESSDPWSYRSAPYEREKYASTLAAVGDGSFARALEVGCSIGVFTEQLARRCESLIAVDFSVRAVTLARERLRALDHVEVRRASFPEAVPAGTFSLVVCSEVLYYLDREGLERALGWLEAQLEAGSALVAVSWRGDGAIEPFRGDDVHDLMGTRFGRWHDLDARRPGYRLDRFQGDGR